jgi:PucR C-terminal helix-turn-helix domain
MIWEQMKERLAAILHAPVSLRTITLEQWVKFVKPVGANPSLCKSVRQDQEILFYLQMVDEELLTLVVGSSELTESERCLIELTIESGVSLLNDTRKLVSEERDAAVYQLRDWILEQIKIGAHNLAVPDSLIMAPLLTEGVIPLLLSTDKLLQGEASYDAFKKLLKQFFGTEVMLIPLSEKEWLIFATEELLNPDSIEENGPIEEQLDAIAMGLHEMLAAEWALESHISILNPIIPANQIIATINRLREAIMVGRIFHVNNNVHLPWELHLESLLYFIPENRMTIYLQQLLSETTILDAEMQTTLVRFFELDCNVSETAKQLFIHRNTLLYRFDKFKQETGFDVRSFRDAVLVRIALELYKVTKRKR